MFSKKILFLLVILLSAKNVFTQFCTGSLGDPVVNITFGDGVNPDINFTPPAAYTYTSQTCPNDGSYTITRSTSGCFGGNWHTVSSDHTGGGAFMLVNASYTPGDFFSGTVTGLCPNTTYEFAAWVMNVLRDPGGIRPDLTFTITALDGTVLNQFNTGGISTSANPVWNQYGFFFSTTAGNTSVRLQISNNAPGGNGNDLALDDITFRPCGPDITSVITGTGLSADVCVNDQTDYLFNAVLSPGFTDPVYQWQQSKDNGRSWQDITGANGLSYTRMPSDTGLFLYRLTVSEAGNATIPGCRVASNQLKIYVHPRPLIRTVADRILIKGDSIQLAATVTGEDPAYSWTPTNGLSDPAVLNPMASPAADILYKLSAVSVFGCSAEGYVRVKVVNGIFVPTAFTPNNDGINDYWTIPYLDPQLNATVMLFNRQGQLVYKTTGGTVQWDGTIDGVAQPSGVYVYIVQFPRARPMMKGFVTLIR